MPPHRVGFLRCFGLKTGIHFAHFGLESGMVFEGITGVYERIYCFNSKWVRKEREICEYSKKWIRIIFCLLSNLGNDNILSAWKPGLKTRTDFRGLVWKRVWKITLYWSESGSGFQELGGTSGTQNTHEYPPPPFPPGHITYPFPSSTNFTAQ